MILFEETKRRNFGLKLIFLDMDGVLTDHSCYIKKDKFESDKRYSLLEKDEFEGGVTYNAVRQDFIDNLKRIIKDTKAKIVITSLRKCHPDKSWMNKLEKMLDTKIYGTTPKILDIFSDNKEQVEADFDRDPVGNCKQYFRLKEISEYLKLNDCQNYVILDDMPLFVYKKVFPELIDHFIQTADKYGNLGLSLFKSLEAIRFLNGGKKSDTKGWMDSISMKDFILIERRKNGNRAKIFFDDDCDRYHYQDIVRDADDPKSILIITKKDKDNESVKQIIKHHNEYMKKLARVDNYKEIIAHDRNCYIWARRIN